MEDSRTTLRYPVEMPAQMTLGTSALSCVVHNVSLGGVFVRGPNLTSGTKIVLRFGGEKLPQLELACTARWNTPDGTGLQFDGLGAVDARMLSKLIGAGTRPTGRIPTDAVLRRTQG